MCGIFGVIDFGDGVPPSGLLTDSARSMGHRGPDSIDIHAERGVGLGHARLSLVDMSSRSNQPMHDPSGRYTIVFNGEIYNFRELRDELRRTFGSEFRTTSDTEVLLEMLIRHGPEAALARLNGMFALGFVDRERRSVVLARDRFGMKPLNYAIEGGRLLFASEVKALRPWTTLAPDFGSVTAYLMNFGGPTKGVTFYEGVRQLAPGAFLEFRAGGAHETRDYFAPTDFLDPAEYERLARLSDAQVVDEFEARMSASIEAHAFADARVGAFCSGGVDSSLIVALAARKAPDIALFHADVKGAWSEADAARALARHLKLDLHCVEVEEADFVASIPKVMHHYEHPFTYHPNCAPLMMIAQLARDGGVKGLLSGEGSDELFLGYPWLGRKRITDAWDGMRAALTQAVRGLPAVGRILLPDPHRNFLLVRDILNGREIRDDMNRAAGALAAQGGALSRDRGTAWSLDYMNHHLRTLLHRNDTMGMAASIEARFPFLDNDLARFGVNLPSRCKLRASPLVLEKAHPFVRDKWVVRAAADRHIPKGLSRRIKIGFWTTVFQRLDIDEAFFAGGALGDLLRLSSRQLRDLWAEAPADFRVKLMHLDVWRRVCIEAEDPEVSVRRLRDHVAIRPEGARPAKPERTGGRMAGAYPSAPV